MRNLLGRLNARSPADLTRIARVWRIRLSATDRLAQVAQLYRAMTDIRVVRDLWETLPPSERAVVEALVLGEDAALSLPALASHLGRSETDLRADAISLYSKGILTREGDDDPLPVGELPRLFVPREIALLLRRVHDEMSARDLATTSLGSLLALIDDRDLEEAAERWGLRVIPGLRGREELATQLQQAIATPGRRDVLLARLDPVPRAIWESVRGRPGGAARYVETIDAAGLTGDDEATAGRRRAALAALEESLLVWHAYTPGGERLLFVPAEIRQPGELVLASLAAPAALTGSVVPERVSPTHAVAWDLLTLLRAIAQPASIRLTEGGGLPPPLLRTLAPRFWLSESGKIDAGYTAFLLELAELQQLVTGSDPASDAPLALTPAIRAWRDRGFVEQTSRLRADWLACGSWIEGEARDDIDVIGADWAGFRLKLLAHLGALQAQQWYALDDIATWLARRDPDMLGATFQAATARAPDTRDDAARRRTVIADVVTVTLQTAARWFGLVEFATAETGAAFRMTEFGAAIVHGRVWPEAAPSSGPAIALSPDATIVLNEPSPLRVWSLTAFAEPVTLGPPAVYRIDEASVQRALAAGFAVTQITTFLAQQSGAPPPAGLLEAVDRWARGSKSIQVEEAIVLTPADPAHVEALAVLAAAEGLSTTELPGGLLVRGRSEETARLLAAIRRAGYTTRTPAATRRPARS